MSAIRLLPWAIHEALEYVAGVFLILAPFLFGFRDSPAFPVLVAAGVVLLAIAVLTGGTMGVVDVLPPQVHAALDYVAALFLILAPFLFAFTDVDAALFSSLFLGVAVFIVSVITAYPHHRPAETETAS
jgi:hypothetical protein